MKILKYYSKFLNVIKEKKRGDGKVLGDTKCPIGKNLVLIV